MFADKRQTRLRKGEAGFTLFELLIVLVIIGIMLTVAVPSYVGFRKRAQSATAKANVRMARPAVHAYYVDNRTYVGMTNAILRSTYNRAIPTTVTLSSLTATSYRLSQVNGPCTASVTGPSGAITVTGSGCS